MEYAVLFYIPCFSDSIPRHGNETITYNSLVLYTIYVCFAIVVIVIEMLDGMKKGKENYAAREAIKFLERELQSGNKFIRAQKFHETLQPGKRKPAKMDTQAWYAFTIDGFMTYTLQTHLHCKKV